MFLLGSFSKEMSAVRSCFPLIHPIFSEALLLVCKMFCNTPRVAVRSRAGFGIFWSFLGREFCFMHIHIACMDFGYGTAMVVVIIMAGFQFLRWIFLCLLG